MSVETWGQLDKSQIDNEKIEGAINRLIAEHEADPDSHLGAGESLEAHRASEVIDHVIASVVADKESLNEIKWNKIWDSQGAWYFSATTGVESYANLTLYIEAGLSDTAEAYTTLWFDDFFYDWTIKNMFKTRCKVDNNDAYEAYLGFMGGGAGVPAQGYGFYFDGTVVKGYWVNSLGLQFTAALGPSPISEHSYAAIYDPDANTITFYIDGVIESVESTLGTLAVGITRFRYYMIRNTASDNTLRVADTFIAGGWK